MNFVGLMVSMVLMTIGAVGTYRFIEEPYIAANRFNAQTKADATVETLQAKVRQGADLAYANGVLTLDGTAVPVPSSCSILTSYQGATGYFVKCWDTSIGNGDHNENNLARTGIARLTTSNPCGSELFPATHLLNDGGDRVGVCAESNPPPPLGDLVGGHLDLDSYTGYKTKGLHVHEWNLKYPSRTFIELMDKDGNMDGVPQAIPEVIKDTSKKFAILIVNAKLSPLVQIRINGTLIDMKNFSANTATLGTRESPKPYTLGIFGGPVVAGTLQSIKISLPVNILTNAGLIPTSTGYVNTSSPLPGKCKEYRNGALVIQLVALNSDGSNITAPIEPFTSGCPTGTPYTSNGGLGLATTNVLYEASFFWHGKKAIYNSSSSYIPENPASVVQYLQ